MHQTEYEYLKSISSRLITADDLNDLKPRTLLLGITKSPFLNENRMFHVYLEDGKIKVVEYHPEGNKKIHFLNKVEENEDYLPKYYIYPQYSDLEFCLRLKEAGLKLKVDKYKEPVREATPYYGEIYK